MLKQAELLAESFIQIRKVTEALCESLLIEDFGVQASPDVSPPKWHLAHTTWFFEAFLLQRIRGDYRPFDSKFAALFNSYYLGQGAPWDRGKRGLLFRPTVEEIFTYRSHVDEEVLKLLDAAGEEALKKIGDVLVLGGHHEQQHQELLVTDIKFNFCTHPLKPVFRVASLERASEDVASRAPPRWIFFSGGEGELGCGPAGFAFDNERPRHRIHLNSYLLRDRPVTNSEFIEFIEAGGYKRPSLWLSEGWNWVQESKAAAPMYWESSGHEWWTSGLSGFRPVDPDEPACHLNYFEADAFARWKRARLPTEAEWENAARAIPLTGNFLESGRLKPRPAPAETAGPGLRQVFGDVWEWTSSAYAPYPGFKAFPGVLGEYNGKFMCNQMILRGGSCATPASHVRATYRNFFSPGARWQFSGARLAVDAESWSQS